MRRLERHTFLHISLTLSCILWALKTEACCDGARETAARGLAARWETWKHPVLRKRALEITKKQMLNLMGLEDLPKPNRKVIPHVFMLDLYKSLSKGKHSNAELVSTVRGVVDQGKFVCKFSYLLVLSVFVCLYLFNDFKIFISHLFIVESVQTCL